MPALRSPLFAILGDSPGRMGSSERSSSVTDRHLLGGSAADRPGTGCRPPPGTRAGRRDDDPVGLVTLEGVGSVPHELGGEAAVRPADEAPAGHHGAAPLVRDGEGEPRERGEVLAVDEDELGRFELLTGALAVGVSRRDLTGARLPRRRSCVRSVRSPEHQRRQRRGQRERDERDDVEDSLHGSGAGRIRRHVGDHHHI